MRKITIAVDGYSSCGKSTLAKDLALKLGYTYVDTGAMYRAVTLYSIRNRFVSNGSVDAGKLVEVLPGIHLSFCHNPGTGRSEVMLNKENVEHEIRQMQVSGAVSKVAAIKQVREKMIRIQREMGKEKGVVMDGRDIGTNVFPDAELKIFMTADPDVRTQRRMKELEAKGVRVTFEEVKNNLLERDREDTQREHNPLTRAKDAVVLDNTHHTRETQLEFAYKLAMERMK